MPKKYLVLFLYVVRMRLIEGVKKKTALEAAKKALADTC